MFVGWINAELFGWMKQHRVSVCVRVSPEWQVWYECSRLFIVPSRWAFHYFGHHMVDDLNGEKYRERQVREWMADERRGT